MKDKANIFIHEVLMKPRGISIKDPIKNNTQFFHSMNSYKESYSTQVKIDSQSKLKKLEKSVNNKKYPDNSYFTVFDLIKFGKHHYYILLVQCLIVSVMMTAIPIIFKKLIEWLSDENSEDWYGYVYLGLIMFILLFKLFVERRAVLNFHRGAVLTKNIIQGLVVNKISNLPQGLGNSIDFGKISNLLISDLNIIVDCLSDIDGLTNSPFILLIYTVQIIIELSWVGIFAPLVIFISIWVQSKINNKLYSHNSERKKFSDNRIKRVAETINGIRIIKLSAWEKIIFNIFTDLRKKEKSKISKVTSLRGIGESISTAIPSLCSLVCFSIYNYFVDELELSQIFSLLVLFQMLITPLKMFLWSSASLKISKISTRRISEILKLPERQEIVNDHSLPRGTIEVLNGKFSWEDNSYKNIQKLYKSKQMKIKNVTKNGSENVLKNINLEFQSGSFSVILGKVGSGKSSLLLALMNELVTKEGKICKNGSVAYVPQESFLLNDTFKNNILFGKPFDSERYNHVVRICQLEPDLKILPGGHETEIGERGLNLSGGQKQRISIARAVYSNSDIFIIDDCLSALDANVGKKILDEVLNGELKEKTKIMVSHHLHFLSTVDQVILMKNGKILEKGIPQYVLSTQAFIDYSQIIKKFENKNLNEDIQVEIPEKEDSLNQISDDQNQTRKIIRRTETRRFTKSLSTLIIKDKDIGKLTKKESRFTGHVGWDIYRFYLSLGGFGFAFFVLLNFLLTTFSRIAADWWIGQWSKDSFPSLSTSQYIYIYAGITFLFIIFVICKSITFGKFTSNVSFNTYKKLIWNILRRKMEFFDTTPIGQIINRCGEDIEVFDYEFPMVFGTFFDYFLLIIGSLILAGIVTPLVIILIIIIVILFIHSSKKFLKTSTELRRLNQRSISPILSRVQELMEGQTSINTYNARKHQLKIWEKSHDLNKKLEYHELVSIIWLNVRVEFSIISIVFLTGFLIVYSKNKNLNGISDISTQSLISSYLFSLSDAIGLFIRTMTNIVKGMSSIQRIKEYIDFKEFEADFENPEEHKNWPIKGSIDFENVSVRYRKGLPKVIKNLNFNIKDNEKVGIVGRTGSGKSTLLLTLTRLLELHPEKKTSLLKNGQIIIDGVDISTLSLHELRSKITVIPQDPWIMEGSLQFAVDPFNKFSEEEILKVVNKVGLSESIKGEILKYQISTSGSNLSLGQRQLLSFTRAILEKPKILLLDEATSNLDKKTDKKIQELLKEQFKNTTIITIAHRLETIMSYDKIVVLETGRLAEFGTVQQLLNIPNGIFRSMVDEQQEKR